MNETEIQFKGPDIVHADSQSWLTEILKNNRVVVNDFINTCAFPAVSSRNIFYE